MLPAHHIFFSSIFAIKYEMRVCIVSACFKVRFIVLLKPSNQLTLLELWLPPPSSPSFYFLSLSRLFSCCIEFSTCMLLHIYIHAYYYIYREREVAFSLSLPLSQQETVFFKKEDARFCCPPFTRLTCFGLCESL